MKNQNQVEVIIEQRFYCCEKGDYWTENSFPYDFWQRYLTVFSRVNIVARVQHVATPQKNWHRVDGENVSFSPLPFYVGLAGFVRTFPALINALFKQRDKATNVVFRIPGVLSLLYQLVAMKRGQKYAAEVVGDPADTFSSNASRSFLRPLIRSAFIKMLRKQCQNACSIAYVTETSLQKRYPPAKEAFHTHYSSIQLQKNDYKQRENYNITAKDEVKTLKILCIGNLAQPYKGCDFMLATLAEMRKKEYQFQLNWVGGGGLLDEMKTLAKSLGIDQQVNFIGNLSEREQISAQLDNADVFVLCSRQEGLPRVVIEAMARSLVCIATNVGGVPELLASEQIIERDNIEQLMQKLTGLYKMDEAQLLAISQTNYSKALAYENSVLAERRKQMYQALLDN